MEDILSRPTFVIHLPRSRDRLPYVTEQIKKAGYRQVSIFKAIDGMDTSSVKESLDFFNHPPIGSIKPGALGCLLSHMKLLNYIIEQNIQIANIFEDDVHFHPEWNILSNHYYALTPKDYEVLFIGNQLDHCLVPHGNEITTDYCYCTHAYIVTLEGAKKMLNTILQYKLGNGLCEIDCILVNVLNKNKSEGIQPPFILYSWNGTKYPCLYNSPSTIHCRNTGLVFQNIQFISQIDDSKIKRDSKIIQINRKRKNMVML